MRWPENGHVTADDDYRSPEVIDRLERHAGRGVLVLGTSRMGKTSLLMRLRERHRSASPPADYFDLGQPPADVLQSVRDSQGLLLLDEGQRLLSWPEEALANLHRLLKGRPFVMAGWPSLWATTRPVVLDHLLDDVHVELLPPLDLRETGRMVRLERYSSPQECSQEVVDAIYAATAGLPNLVARLCMYLTQRGSQPLRPPDSEDLIAFIEVLAHLSDPFKDIYASLPPRMQQLLEAHQRGDKPRLDALCTVGLAAGSPARLSGSLLESVWGSGSDWQPQRPHVEVASRRTSSKSLPLVKWIHLSDLHFGAGPQAHRFNQKAVIEAIRRDIEENLPWAPDYIFVTGDIAFSAQPAQYKQAAEWLREVARAARTHEGALRLVPGNHDVDRKRAGETASTNAIQAIRQQPHRLDENLHAKQERKLLYRKLCAYDDFVKAINPTHPLGAEDSTLDWSEGHPLGAHGLEKLWLVGLSTVWVSDKDDAEGNLIIGEQQLQALNGVRRDELLLLLTHHPPDWLHPGSEELLLSRMAERASHLHLCGHVHSARARIMRGLGVERDSIRVVAGAAHGEAPEEHGYAWGALRWKHEQWELGWAPRLFVKGRGMRADRTRYELDDEGFAWEPLRAFQGRGQWPGSVKTGT